MNPFSPTITFFHLDLNTDWYEGDHCPRFWVLLGILNFKLLELSIFYRHHRTSDGGTQCW